MLDLLRPMAVFARTVEAGSFRAAAKLLGMSPSVVSHHVAQLEARLGVALLYRSTRRLSLTADGTTLFAAARAMLDAATSGLDQVTPNAAAPTGQLRITVPSVLAGAFLTDDIAAFAADHPKVLLDVSFSDRRRDLIGEGIDLAIRLGWLADSSLKAVRLRDLGRVLVAAPGYLVGRPPPHRPEDLTGLDWLRLSALPARTTLIGADGASVVVDYAARLLVDDALAMYRLARAGLGLAAVPDFLAADDLASGRMVEVLPGWRPDGIGLFAVWPPNAPRAGLTRRFVTFLAACTVPPVRPAMDGG